MSGPAQRPLLFGRWSFRQLAIALFLVNTLVCAVRVGNLPLTKSDEVKFTEASREMLERGDWIVPHFNNEYRFDKPPLIYWCQAPLLAVFGYNDETARLHSAIATGLLVVVIFAFGARAFNPEAGFWAAVIFSTSLSTVIHGSMATADMLLTLCVALAFWSGWELTRIPVDTEPSPEGKPVPAAWRSGWWWMFYLSLTLCFLAKGPAGWMPLFALPLYVYWARPTRVNRRFRLGLGLPLTLALFAIWAVPAYIATHGAFLRVGIGDHVITRMTQGYDHHGAPNFGAYVVQSPFYFVMVWASFAGWSTWFPWCYKQLRAQKFQGSTERYLLSGILVTFFIFTLGWSRRGYYTMPCFPLIAILFAGLWCRAGRSRLVLGWMGAIITIVSVLLTPITRMYTDWTRPARKLVQECVPYLHPESAFATIDLDQATFVWYFRHHVRDFRRLLTPEEGVKFMAEAGPRFCVMETKTANKLFPTLPEGWKRFDAPREGIYSGRENKFFLVSVLVKP